MKVQDEPRIATSPNCQSKYQFIIVPKFASPIPHILQKKHYTHTHTDYNALNAENWSAFDAFGSVYYGY